MRLCTDEKIFLFFWLTALSTSSHKSLQQFSIIDEQASVDSILASAKAAARLVLKTADDMHLAEKNRNAVNSKTTYN